MIGLEIMQLIAILAMNSIKHIHIEVTKTDLHIQCEMESAQLDPPNITSVENLYIHRCKPSTFSLLFPSNTTKLLTLKKLELNAMPADPPLTAAHFKNLSVNELIITGSQRLEPSSNFLNPLTMVTNMTVSNMVLPPLPATSNLEVMSLSNGRSGAIGGCSALKEMYLNQWTVEDTSGGWLSKCDNLYTIKIERVSVETINRVLHSANAVLWLIINECALVSLSADMLIGAPDLRFLYIKSSGLRSINESAFDHHKTLLTFLDLSDNELRGETSARAILGLSKLQSLHLEKNPLSDFCEHFNTMDRTLRPRFLHLEETGISRLCFGSWTSLQILGLEKNNITEMTLTELPAPSATTKLLTVNLEQNPMHAPLDTYALYEALKKKFGMLENYSLTIKTNFTLDCDCQHGWFGRALRALPSLKMEGMHCHNNSSLEVTPWMQLECEKYECEPCTCRRSWSDNKTLADCHNRSLHHVPRIPGVHSLIINDNLIKVIHADDFSTSMQFVDLSNNKLRRMDAATAHALLAEGSTRHVRFAGNPFVCDCENEPLINALQNYTTRVDDYAQLKCANSETALAQVIPSELCDHLLRVWVLAVVAVGCVLAALAAIATALYFRYSRAIRVFLHARGLLCCLNNDETDADFLYDAFISFSHQDANFVDEELLPWLENESNGWRICVHYRDWVAGEMIPTQIACSIAQSRRTIVVLSRNFLESMWGMLEFRMAYAHAMQDGCPRLVLIVLDDVVDSDQLNGEVRGFVCTNTYIRWGDPWFWDKLFYAMPPRRTTAS